MILCLKHQLKVMISRSCPASQTARNNKIPKIQKLRALYVETTLKRVIVPMDINASSHMVYRNYDARWKKTPTKLRPVTLSQKRDIASTGSDAIFYINKLKKFRKKKLFKVSVN